MPISRVKKEINEGIYFVTPTIWNWYYIFDRYNRWQIIADSIKYCQKSKGLLVYAYVFMLNHIHIIIKSPDVAGFLRDFKKYTSTQLIVNIKENEPNVLTLFKHGEGFRFWKEDNQPKLIENERFALQKINYIHNNPVVKGYVELPEHWRWSSANCHSEIKVVDIFEVG